MAPIIIPFFLPHLGCRERCLFCNQKAMVREAPPPEALNNLIVDSLSRIRPGQEMRERQIAFYGGSFTALERERQEGYLKEVQPFLSSGRIDSIRLSTRPDALGRETLARLREYGVKTIEIGAQSMVDEVLLLSRRGHGAGDTLSAISLLRDGGFEVGVHLMIGLPGDSRDFFLLSLERLSVSRPDFIRIHPTLVLRGSPLEVLWRTGRYSPLALDETIEWLKRGMLKLERASIPITRVGLQPTPGLEEHLLAGPFHPALHQLVRSSIYYEMAVSLLQGFSNGPRPAFFCHPREVSNLRGQGNENILRLKRHFKLDEILILEREDIPRGELMLQAGGKTVSIDRSSFDS